MEHNFSATNINGLFLLQKKIIRLLCNARYDAPTAPLFSKLCLPKIQDLLKYRLAYTHTLECKNNTKNISLIANLQINHTPYPTRLSERWKVPRPRTNYTLQMIGYTLPKLLNGLAFIDFDIDSCTKSMLFNLFVRKDYDVWE